MIHSWNLSVKLTQIWKSVVFILKKWQIFEVHTALIRLVWVTSDHSKNARHIDRVRCYYLRSFIAVCHVHWYCVWYLRSLRSSRKHGYRQLRLLFNLILISTDGIVHVPIHGLHDRNSFANANYPWFVRCLIDSYCITRTVQAVICFDTNVVVVREA